MKPNSVDPSWQPLALDELKVVMSNFTRRWWLAGGWAIDSFLGHQTRAHDDTDIVVLRDDQLALQAHFKEWEVFASDPPGSLRRWSEAMVLGEHVHDIWMRRAPHEKWALQVMLLDSASGDWIYRRDSRVSGNLDSYGFMADKGLNCIRPEIQLLYKSKSVRDKDQQDFLNVLPVLADSSRSWLLRNLELVCPHGHPWIDSISALQDKRPPQRGRSNEKDQGSGSET